jgi:hypothetical protein
MQRREFITLIGHGGDMASRRTRAAARDAGSRISARRLAKLSRQSGAVARWDLNPRGKAPPCHGAHPKLTFRAEGDHSRHIRCRALVSIPGPAISYRRHWAGVLGGNGLLSF